MSEGAETQFESSCTCAICMDELGTSIEACPCGHVYHSRCIREWIHQKRICPQCKGDALPLIPLHFNLLRLHPEEKAHSSAERISAIKNDIVTAKLNIDNEIAEINVLEPQLAESRAEERAYSEGIGSRERRKSLTEAELELARHQLATHERRRKELNDQVEAMRDKINRMVDISTVPSRRRHVQSSDVPKLVSFLSADTRKLREIDTEKNQLNQELGAYKQELAEVHRKIREASSSSSSASADKSFMRTSLKNVNLRTQGFVPIDVFGHKRRRDEEHLKEVENRKPTLFVNGEPPLKKSEEDGSSLAYLSNLVGILSDDDELMDQNATQPVNPIPGSLESFFSRSSQSSQVVIELD